MQSNRQRWAAPGSSHDRVVAMLRIALPLAVGVLLAFLIMAPLLRGGDVSFLLDKDKVEVAKERLRIQSARYRGEDSKGQPFVLSAGSAVQRSSSDPVVRIEDLSAAIRLPEGPAVVRANHGRYDMNSEQVAVDGPIAVRGPNDYRLNTRDAVVDLKSRQLQSRGAVVGSTPMGNFSANRLKADLEQRSVVLEGDAKLRVYPGGAP